jgi:hypothetical protein
MLLASADAQMQKEYNHEAGGDVPDRTTGSCSQPPAGAWGCWDIQRLLSYGDGDSKVAVVTVH